MLHQRQRRLAAVCVALCLVIAACAGTPATTPPSATPPSTAPSPVATPLDWSHATENELFLAIGSPTAASAAATSTPTPSTHVYAGVFTPTGDLSAARMWPTATLLPDGRVLFAGGLSTAGSSSDAGFLACAELYDPASGIFTPTGNLAAARMFDTATLLPDGLVLVAGGWNGLSRTSSAVSG
jgi:hypothetical protein